MHILLLATAYNSLTQRAHVELAYRNHEVSIELALSDRVMVEAVELYQPDLIIAPFLKTAIPEKIWRNYLCIIIHPGIKGDRGPSSLDWAILNGAQTWGVTALQADREMDAGDIWSSVNFKMRPVSKSCLYRNEVAQAAVQAILQTVERVSVGKFVPEPLDYSREDVQGYWCPSMKQQLRAINWTSDPVSTILKKIRSADSQPGLLDTLDGEKYYLYGVHEEDTLTGNPGEIIAQRHGAICRAAIDGAVWLSHLKKKKKKGERDYFKLPAAMVLGEQLKNVPEVPLPLEVPAHRKTFKEIWYEEKNQVGYLHFDFYNGAMSTEQSQRLKDAYLQACSRPTKVIVLMGGQDFWSNGCHLNVIEAAENQAEESWRNINAINDFVQAILTTNSKLTIAAMQGNAAAGGVMIALAADRVYARSGIVLNPHYKRMGLYGSEYWTYSLPKRVGQKKATELTEDCMPIGTQVAQETKLIDSFFGDDSDSFREQIMQIAEASAQSPDYDRQLALKNKKRFLDRQFEHLEVCRQEELKQMRINFFSPDQNYHSARFNFVYKVTPLETPLYLAKHRQEVNSLVNKKRETELVADC